MSADPISPVLRDSTPDDIPAIAAIYRHAVETGRASFELAPPDEAEMARRREALVGGGFPYIVADEGGAVVGYAYVGPYRPRPAYAKTVENSVYIRPDRQGHGLGRLLLARLIDEAAGRGFRQMVAVIGDPQGHGSVRLHESLGFRMVGTLRAVGWKHERWLDTTLMQLSLGPGDGSPP